MGKGEKGGSVSGELAPVLARAELGAARLHEGLGCEPFATPAHTSLDAATFFSSGAKLAPLRSSLGSDARIFSSVQETTLP